MTFFYFTAAKYGGCEDGRFEINRQNVVVRKVGQTVDDCENSPHSIKKMDVAWSQHLSQSRKIPGTN